MQQEPIEKVPPESEKLLEKPTTNGSAHSEQQKTELNIPEPPKSQVQQQSLQSHAPMPLPLTLQSPPSNIAPPQQDTLQISPGLLLT